MPRLLAIALGNKAIALIIGFYQLSSAADVANWDGQD